MSPSGLSKVTPYVGRLLEDQYVQEQIRDAMKDLRRGSQRAKRKGARGAVADKRVRSQLAAAGGSLSTAVQRLRQPEPPQRHWLRRGLLVVAAGAGGVLAWQQINGSGASHGGA
jgi:ferric-dicitrate binding protein FerR (iron transport regulator)